MPRKKTVTEPVADVTETVETAAAAEPITEPTPEPRTGATYLIDRLTLFVDRANETWLTEQAQAVERLAVNPAYLITYADALVQAQEAWGFSLNVAANLADPERGLPAVLYQIDRLEEACLRPRFSSRSTCAYSNVVEGSQTEAKAEIVRTFRDWQHHAVDIDADLAAKADQAEALKVELAPGVTMADYEALRRQSRTFELQAANIDDVVATFKAAGLKYLGQRKADLIRMLVNHEFKA